MSDSAGSVLREIARLHSLMQRTKVACCDGTTLTQCHIISELGKGGPMTLMDLRNRLSLDKGWLSRAVDALGEEGLVAKEVGKSDRRTVSLTLSAAGMERFMAIDQVLDDNAAGVMARIPEEERAKVLHALQLVEAALRAEVAAYACGATSNCSCDCHPTCV